MTEKSFMTLTPAALDRCWQSSGSPNDDSNCRRWSRDSSETRTTIRTPSGRPEPSRFRRRSGRRIRWCSKPRRTFESSEAGSTNPACSGATSDPGVRNSRRSWKGNRPWGVGATDRHRCSPSRTSSTTEASMPPRWPWSRPSRGSGCSRRSPEQPVPGLKMVVGLEKHTPSQNDYNFYRVCERRSLNCLKISPREFKAKFINFSRIMKCLNRSLIVECSKLHLYKKI